MREDRFLRIYGFLHLWIFTAGILLLLLHAGGAFNLRTGVKLLLLAVPALALREISVRGKKIWSFLGVSALCLAVFWFLGERSWERACLLLGVLFFVFLFFWQRLTDNREAFFQPSYACLPVFALEYIFSLAYGLDTLGNLFLIFTGCYWLLILWSRNREHFLDYCGDYDRLYRFPKQGIAWESRLMLIFLTVLSVGCMGLLPFLGIDRGILAVLDLIRRFLAMLLSGAGEETEPEEFPAEESAAQPMVLEPGGEPSPFLAILWEILEKILILAVVLGTAAAVYAFLFWLYKKYNSQVLDNGDILEKLETPKKETTERLKKKGIFVPDFLKARTPKTRIRRAYKRKIEAAGKPSVFASPRELEDQAGIPLGGKREEFHRLYEKARYGNSPCTQEEAKRMRELERVDFS